MAAQLPDARRELIEGVGHAAHLEDPEGFARIASAFLAQADPTEDPTGDPT